MRRSRAAVSVLAGLLTAGLTAELAVPPTARAVTFTRGTSSTATLAPGVTLTRSSFALRTGGRSLPERVFTLHVRLSAHTQLDAASPGNVIGAHRVTTLALARQEKAVAGINGDTFYFSDPTAVPRGGLSRGGRILKSALAGKNAVLRTTTDGRAFIGDPGWAGRIHTVDARGRSRDWNINSVNSLENARNGGVSFVDGRVATRSLPSCTVVALRPAGTAWRVTGITTRATRWVRVAAADRGLVTCSAKARAWMTDALRTGRTLTASAGYTVRGTATLLSGVRQLIRGGRRFTDRTGLNVYGDQRKPNSFGCVLTGERDVLLGTVEGDAPGRSGMTYADLTTYLLGRGCRSALVFDGSHTATLVAKSPGHALTVRNRTTGPHGGQMQVVDGLFVVRR